MLTTYLYPHLKGRMTRWLEQNIGNLALSKDELAAVRQAQKLYHSDRLDTDDVAEEMGISKARASRYIRYNIHFFGVYDLVQEDYDGDPFERLMPGKLSAPTDQIVYRKVCIELLQEMFDVLPKKDRDSLGKFFGIFRFEKTPLKEIGMYHMMKKSDVEKAKDRAIKKLEKAYPGNKLQLWKTVHRLMRRPILPPEDDTELRVQFSRYVHTLAEVYGMLNEATTKEDDLKQKNRAVRIRFRTARCCLAHDSDFIAVFVHICGVLAMVGTLAFQPSETRHIDHVIGSAVR